LQGNGGKFGEVGRQSGPTALGQHASGQQCGAAGSFDPLSSQGLLTHISPASPRLR
jgi:hypothetical protein